MEAIRWTLAHLLHHIYVLSWICPLLYLCQNGKLPVFLFLNPGMSPRAPPPPPPTLITTPTACLDLYGQCVGSSFFQKAPAELISFTISPYLCFRSTSEPRISAPSCSSRNLEIAHDKLQPPSPVCRSLRLLSNVTSAATSSQPSLPAHFLSGLYHCLWTVSPLLSVLPRLPLHSTALKHGCHILLPRPQTLTFVPLKPRIKSYLPVWSGSCHSVPFLTSPPIPHCVLAMGLSVVQMCPVFCLVAPMRLDSHPLLSLPLTAPNSAQSFCTLQSKLRKTELWLISFWTILM